MTGGGGRETARAILRRPQPNARAKAEAKAKAKAKAKATQEARTRSLPPPRSAALSPVPQEREEGDGLHRLAEPHLVRQHAVHPDLSEQTHPVHPH